MEVTHSCIDSITMATTGTICFRGMFWNFSILAWAWINFYYNEACKLANQINLVKVVFKAHCEGNEKLCFQYMVCVVKSWTMFGKKYTPQSHLNKCITGGNGKYLKTLNDVKKCKCMILYDMWRIVFACVSIPMGSKWVKFGTKLCLWIIFF